MWIILTVLALPGITINTFGPGNEVSAPTSGLAGTTLRNLYSSNPNATIALPGTAVSAEFAALVYTGCDFLGVCIFAVGYVFLRYMLAAEVRLVSSNVVSASDYSVYLPVVSPDMTEEVLEEWVERVATKVRADKLRKATAKGKAEAFSPSAFRIVDLNIVENNSGILELMTARARVVAELHRVEAKLRSAKAGRVTFMDECTGCFAASELKNNRRNLLRRMKRVADRIMAIKSSRAKRSRNEQQAVAAFITFESCTDKEDFVLEFPQGYVASCFRPKGLELAGKAVEVLPAPEPSAVIWTNLHVNKVDQFTRGRMSDFFSVWVILFSFIIIFFASWQSDKYSGVLDRQTCGERETAAWLSRYDTYHTGAEEAEWQNATTTGSADPRLFCLCELQGWEALPDIPAVLASPWATACVPQFCNRLFILDSSFAYDHPACGSWSLVKTTALIFTTGASVVVLVINALLGIILRYLADWEGHHSLEYRDTSVAIRLFFAQFFNTAVLLILVNIAWPDISYEGARYRIGQYTDITSGWYDNVGASLMTTMIINWVSPHTYYGMSGLCLRWHMRKEGAIPRLATQEDLNTSFVGLPMDLALRHAQLLNVVFVTYVFSTGMPLLIPIGAVSFFLNYWVDKVLFVRYYSLPPMTSHGVTRALSGLLPLALLLHLGFGVWMLGSVGAFNKALSAYSPLDYSSMLSPYLGTPPAGAPAVVAGEATLGGVIIEALVLDTATNESTPYRFYVPGYGGFNDTATLYTHFLNITVEPAVVGIPAYDRIFSPSGLPLFVLFVLTLAVYTVSTLLTALGKAAVGTANVLTCGAYGRLRDRVYGKGREGDKPSPLFTLAVSERAKGTALAMQGTPTYNILGQPDLQRALHIDPRLAALSNSLIDAAFTDEAEVGQMLATVARGMWAGAAYGYGDGEEGEAGDEEDGGAYDEGEDGSTNPVEEDAVEVEGVQGERP